MLFDANDGHGAARLDYARPKYRCFCCQPRLARAALYRHRAAGSPRTAPSHQSERLVGRDIRHEGIDKCRVGLALP